MRIIKFRVWDKLLKRYVKRCDMTDITLDFYGDKQCCSLSDMIFEQLTGLTDKNGKEIYEGDLLQEKEMFDGNPVVAYASNIGAFVALSNNAFKRGEEPNEFNSLCFDEDMFPASKVEVVGNIHENLTS